MANYCHLGEFTHIKETNQEGGEGEKKDVLGLVPFI